MSDPELLGFLQNYWWFLLSLFAGLIGFLSFVQGGQTLMFTVSSDINERNLIINVIGHKWELMFTTLVIYIGVSFAAFPLLYASTLSGGYNLWMIILFTFVVQAVSYEYRSKKGNVLGLNVYDSFLFINGSLGIFCLGMTFAYLFVGKSFSTDIYNSFTWFNKSYGLDAFVNPINLAFGFLSLFVSRVLAELFFINRMVVGDDEKPIIDKVYKHLKIEFILFFVTLLIVLFYIHSSSKQVNMTLIPVACVLYIAAYLMNFKTPSKKSFWIAALATIMLYIGIFFTAGFENEVILKSLFDPKFSLTINNTSSSLYTLKVLSYSSILAPIVLGYVIYTWYVLNKKEDSIKTIKQSKHNY